ncbi:MAG: hypothetical protein B6245_23510 [Desulfobacteraceae bacterium 4572_88]|nr:MAG: hypothetical protein B6245_23510 [Desulfobacteraceae bacterium 4572_88]
MEISGYAPLEIPGLNWAIVTTIRLEEVIAPRLEGENKDSRNSPQMFLRSRFFQMRADRSSVFYQARIIPNGIEVIMAIMIFF